MVAETKYYELLGLSTAATADEIKKAYRKLSLKWHPDKNPSNREEAEERFKQLAEAYSVLSDIELRTKYDQYGEAGLRRNFQPGHGSSQGFAGQSHHHNGEFGFRSRPAHDIFREFFGGQDPFASMFGMPSFGDPFGDPFFSQSAGSSGLRGNAAGGTADRQQRSHSGSGSGVAVNGFGAFGFGGFPSMMFSSPFGGGSTMPASGSFSFISSSTIGGAGGLRGPTGPTTRTSIQVVNGVKMQTVEEDDGHGNVTVTTIDPSGNKEVAVNGVPQKQQTRKNIDDGYARQQQQHQQSQGHDKTQYHQQQQHQQSQYQGQYQSQPHKQSHGQSQGPQGRRTSGSSRPTSARADASAYASNSAAMGGGARHGDSDRDSVVEVEVVEIDSSSEDSVPPPPAPSHTQPAGRMHMASPPAAEPASKRHESDLQQDQLCGRANSHAQQAQGFSGPAHVPVHDSASAHIPVPTQAPEPVIEPAHRFQHSAVKAFSGSISGAASPPRTEGEDLLAAARNKLRPTGNSAAMNERRPQMGIKEALKTTGANLLKGRPRMNRSSSASKVDQQQQQQQQFGPVHRPPPMSAADIKHSLGQTHHNPQPAPPPQMFYASPQSTMAGRAGPGHKQPRSRDRMRSTLHYEDFSAPTVGRTGYATLSSQPPLPQNPIDPRAPTPGYARYQYQQPAAHQYGQATFVNPADAQQRHYGGQPLSATQARNQQQQQQQQYPQYPQYPQYQQQPAPADNSVGSGYAGQHPPPPMHASSAPSSATAYHPN